MLRSTEPERATRPLPHSPILPNTATLAVLGYDPADGEALPVGHDPARFTFTTEPAPPGYTGVEYSDPDTGAPLPEPPGRYVTVYEDGVFLRRGLVTEATVRRYREAHRWAAYLLERVVRFEFAGSPEAWAEFARHGKSTAYGAPYGDGANAGEDYPALGLRLGLGYAGPSLTTEAELCRN